MNDCCDVYLKGALFIVRAGNDIIKTDFMQPREPLSTKMKTGKDLDELQ